MALTPANVIKLVEEIGGALVTLAQVPHPKQAQFLGEVQDALSNWVWNVLAAQDNRLIEKGDRLLRRTFGNADALYNQLSDLLDAFLATARFEEPTPAARVSNYVCVKLDGELGDALNDLDLKISPDANLNITKVLWVLSSLLRAIDGTRGQTHCRPRGARFQTRACRVPRRWQIHCSSEGWPEGQPH